MNKDGINYLLQINGYQMVNSNVPFIKFFVKTYTDSDYNSMDIIGCIDNSVKSSLSVEQLDNIAFQIERKYLFSGIRNVNMIYFIYSDNVERDKVYCEGQTKFWIIDILAEQLIVFENQPEEFDCLRNQIEELFSYRAAQGYPAYSANQSDKRRMAGINRIGINGRNIPLITLLLIVSNVIVFFILEFMGSTNDVSFMLEHGAAYYKNIFGKNEYYRLFTCIFMHFGFAHLFNNMFSLFLLGSETEKFYGKIKFIIIYLISGIAGSLLSAVYNYMMSQNSVSAGASGAIYGLIGALVVKIVEEGRRSKSSFGRIVIVLIILMLIGRSGEGVDNIAHIGGFVAGMISGIVCYKIKMIEKSC